MWFRRKKKPEKKTEPAPEHRIEFAEWQSDWQVHRQKRFRTCTIFYSSPREESVMTLVLPADLTSTVLAGVEAFFEAGVEVRHFKFRSEYDSDPAGVMLRAVEVGDLRVDVDLYYPGVPWMKGYIGMGVGRS